MVEKLTTFTMHWKNDIQRYVKSIFRILQTPATAEDKFFLTDNNWLHGIARNGTGFFVPHNRKFLSEYKIGKLMKLANGESREMSGLHPNGKYLNILLSVKLNHLEQVDVPN